MHYAILRKEGETFDDAADDILCLYCAEDVFLRLKIGTLALLDKVSQVTLVTELKKEVQVVRSLIRSMESHHISVRWQVLENADLSVCTFRCCWHDFASQGRLSHTR